MVDNLQVTMGNYTQFRISGSGYGDDALEDDLARILVDLDIKSDILRKSKKSILKQKYTFDLMIFKDQRDYLCYIEAVSLMYEENILKHCDFVSDPDTFMKSQFDYSKHFGRFMNEHKKAREYFVVIDNTEWP